MYDQEIYYLKERWGGQISARNPDFLPGLCALAQRRCMVGMLGLQSVGKSTLLNSFIGFPVLPSLITKGTVCALTLEYGPRPLLFVYPDAAQRGKPLELTGIFPAKLFRQMLEYVCRCVNETVFYPENIGYFLPEIKPPGSLTPEDFQLDPQDGRHGLLLVLILLNAYFTGASSGSKPEQYVDRERRALLRQTGIDPDAAFSLKLQWNSSLLPRGVCLIDLPGLGSDKNAGEKSLGGLTLAWARRCDILLCLTTGEAVGGLINEALTEIFGGTGDDGSPLPVIIINKAELILSLETSRSAAKQMIPRRDTASYFLSSAAGECGYLDSSIPLEHTQFWRNEFLPAFRSIKPGEEITRADRELALTKLEERYTRAYPCEREDGTYAPVSLQSFLQQELPTLAQRRNLQIFRRVYAGDKNTASYIRALAAKENSLLGDFAEVQKNMLDLWFSEAEAALGRFCADLLQVEAAASEIVDTHQRRSESFCQWWAETVKEMNDQLSQSAISTCGSFLPLFDFIRCSGDSPSTVDDSMENDAYLRELYSTVLDFDMDDILDRGYEDGGNIAVQTWSRAVELPQFIQAAISRLHCGIKALSEICGEHFCALGYDRDQFDHYFSGQLRKLSETLYDDVMPRLSDIPPAPPEPAWAGGGEKPRWRSIRYEWLHRTVNSAALIKENGRIIFKRNHLIEKLKLPMVPERYAGEWIAPFVDPKTLSETFDYLLNLSCDCRSLHDKLTGSWDHMFDAYHKMAGSLSQPLGDKVKRDRGLLRNIQYIIE